MKLKNTQYEFMEKLNCVCKIGRKWIEKRISELMGMVPWQEQALYQICIYSRTQELITQYSLFSILKIYLNIVRKYWIPISTIFLPSCNSEFPCTLILSKWIQIFTIIEENYRYGQGWLGRTLYYQIIIWGNIVRCTGWLAGRQPLKPEGHRA